MARFETLAAKMLATLVPLATGTAGKPYLSVLIYHRVLPTFDYMRPDEPTVADFDWQMALVKRYFTPLSLSDAIVMMDEGTLPDNAICVTFDDGYADNAVHALPILQRYEVPASVFVSTGYLNGGRMWNDTVIEALRLQQDTLDLTSLGLEVYPCDTPANRKDAAHSILKAIKHKAPNERQRIVDALVERSPPLPHDLMMTDEQVRLLDKANIEIGGHTISHPILANLTIDQVQCEIADGKAELERILDKSIRYFAYPNGKPGQDYLPEHIPLVKAAGYQLALATTWGVSSKASDRYQLARFTPWDKTPLRFLLRLLLNRKTLIT